MLNPQRNSLTNFVDNELVDNLLKVSIKNSGSLASIPSFVSTSSLHLCYSFCRNPPPINLTEGVQWPPPTNSSISALVASLFVAFELLPRLVALWITLLKLEILSLLQFPSKLFSHWLCPQKQSLWRYSESFYYWK